MNKWQNIKKESNYTFQFEKFGFKANRTKILMYVFDTTYSWFLKNMLDFKINQIKFENTDNKYKNEKPFIEICDSFKNNKEEENKSKSKFIQFIIESEIPFIFLYIPDVIKVNSVKNNEIEKIKNEIKELKEKINSESKAYDEKRDKIEKISKKTIKPMKTNIQQISVNKKEQKKEKEEILSKECEKEKNMQIKILKNQLNENKEKIKLLIKQDKQKDWEIAKLKIKMVKDEKILKNQMKEKDRQISILNNMIINQKEMNSLKNQLKEIQAKFQMSTHGKK